MNCCTVPNCDKPIKRAGFCYGHYMKHWRYGTPTPTFESRVVDIVGQRFGTLIVQSRQGSKWVCLCDCGNTRVASAGDLNRYGSENTCGDRTTHYRRDDASYSAAHDRCERDRGPARTHPCIDCGGQAQHWSYNHDDPNELLGPTGGNSLAPYSLSPSHYSPRCVPCHKRFDLDRVHVA